MGTGVKTLAYRADIDGLRGLAVLAVVVYHYELAPLHGGFVGVDVFFVISGYLITAIIQKEIERGEFTFGGFYERRVRRIFPALFVVLLATLAAGSWLLLPSDLLKLGSATIATLFFCANVLFWRQAGYFASSSEYNPLLHTWTLAVEEQFYIGLPVLLILLHRFAKGRRKLVLTVCALVSFALCVWVQPRSPSITFFLSPFRAWELLLGGLLAVGSVPAIGDRRLREAVALTSLVILLGSFWWIKAGLGFPGWQAAPPVLATAMLIHTGAHGDSLVRRMLSWRPLVFIGLISYSLYLWHWPLLVFVRYHAGMARLEQPTAWLLMVVALVLAVVSYYQVESPFRRRKSAAGKSSRLKLFAGAGVVVACLTAVSLFVRLDDGWQMRFSKETVAYDKVRRLAIPFVQCSWKAPPHTMSSCVLGDKFAARRILLWGDSYALAWAPAFDALGKRHGFGIELAWLSECPPLVGISISRIVPCRKFNDAVARRIADPSSVRLDAVVLVGHWGAYLPRPSRIQPMDAAAPARKNSIFAKGLALTVDQVLSTDRRLIIIGPTPGAPSDIAYQLAAAKAFDLGMPEGKLIADADAYHARFWDLVGQYESVERMDVINPLPWFEENRRYRYLDDRGNLLFRDAGHLSLDGAAFVESHFPVAVLGEMAEESSSGPAIPGQ